MASSPITSWQISSVQLLSHVQLFATLWTVACQAPVHGIPQARVLEWAAIGAVQKQYFLYKYQQLFWLSGLPASSSKFPFKAEAIFKILCVFLCLLLAEWVFVCSGFLWLQHTGATLAEVYGLLTAVASLGVELRLQAHRLSSCSSPALEHRLSRCGTRA